MWRQPLRLETWWVSSVTAFGVLAHRMCPGLWDSSTLSWCCLSKQYARDTGSVACSYLASNLSQGGFAITLLESLCCAQLVYSAAQHSAGSS